VDLQALKVAEHFSVSASWLQGSNGLRLDASFYNPRLAQALESLKKSGLSLRRLGDVTEQIFIPGRFARTYVQQEHGIPFLQGSHIVHFQPADVKFISPAVHKKISKWIIREGWVLVTRSGTVGRTAIVPHAWDGWAASEHILRIIPKPECPAGYLYAFLNSPVGKIQLTSQIYGAVVDELTEEQTRSVLIPMPNSPAEMKAVMRINELALQAMVERQKATVLATASVEALNVLLPHAEKKHTGSVGDLAKVRLAIR
jgi:type I restriction enzyme S subunit